MRVARIAALAAAGLAASMLVYRNVSSGYSSISDGSGRMSNQHVVVQYTNRRRPEGATHAAQEPPPGVAGGGVAAEAIAAAAPLQLPSLLPPPPPPPYVEVPLEQLPRWLRPEGSALAYNGPARASLARLTPRGTTLHFTFGSSVMMDFVKNWLHFIRKAMDPQPYLVGTADAGLLKFCDAERVPAAAIIPELDVWTYKRKPKPKAEAAVYEMKSEWKYFRHHNSDFLEMGLVKVAFLWELLSAGFHILISDLDVVWLNGHWQRWMSWADALHPPVAEASLIALADVLVTTDELSHERDAMGGRLNQGAHTELNTGVVYFRNTKGSMAMVQQWRKSMLNQKGRKDLNENVNDQSLFNQVVSGAELRGEEVDAWVRERAAELNMTRLLKSSAFAPGFLQSATRRVYRSHNALPPCLPDARCEPSRFTFGTLPMRPFTGGHTWFNQNVQQMSGHELPQNEPITVHFTFQFGDTGDYPHGKRQRAREAALWAVDPPEYFTEGIFVALVGGEAHDPEHQREVYRRFPEWSPQRHMFMDAPQRQAVRDLLGMATAVGAIVVLPKFYCHCDRYWGFLSKCRMPMVPNMKLPFGCPMDSLYLTQRWNEKKVPFREHTFLSNPHVPPAMRENTVTVTVAPRGEAVSAAPSKHAVQLPYGTRLTEVRAAVMAANPSVRVIQIANADLRRLCRWLGSSKANEDFNKLSRYILTESSRYCPTEDMGGYGGPGFDWQNPFTAYNCTWGFHFPTQYPTEEACDAQPSGPPPSGVVLKERSNSTTCPRQMLCDWNTLSDGRETKPITWCNIEGYNGMRPQYLPTTKHMLSGMPDGRCPYPPGNVPGMLGFDSRGHYVGEGRGATLASKLSPW